VTAFGPGLPASAGAVLAAYLLGSISFSYLIVRLVVGVDIRTVGSGNPGATNVMRVAGRGPGVLAFLFDAGKGAAGIALARALDLGVPASALVGVAAVVGHMWPVFFGFRGGKGVATAAGTLGLLVPLATALSLALFVLVVWWRRYVSLGSVTVAIACPLIVAALGAAGHYPPEARWWLTGGSAAIGALIVLKHRANLHRLAAGTESKLGERRLPGDGAPGERGAAG
jgi:acyl phosphate:glycerol-3-phosphate acyltransferase